MRGSGLDGGFPSRSDTRGLSHRRLAVCGVFASFGMVLATWAVHLPTVQQNTGISTSMLGTTLLVLGIGALAGMQVSGALADRFGSGRIAVLSAAAMALTVVPPLMVTSLAWLFVGALIFGVATGTTEVSMNAAAVDTERSFGRPIMSSFHGVFSVGNVVGSLIGAAAFALGLSVLRTASTVIAICLAIAVGAATVLWRRDTSEAVGHLAARSAEPPLAVEPDTTHRRRTLILGILTFLLLLTEGSSMDWSSLHAQRHLGADPSAGALAYGAFVAAMTLGRFTVDRVVRRTGPVRVLRWGSVVGVIGLALVIGSTVLPLTLFGWAVAGLGLSGCGPQVMTAAGNLGGGSGRTLSRVVGIGYLAILAGPAIIGWLADLITLNGAFVVPLIAAAICAFAAHAVTPAPSQ